MVCLVPFPSFFFLFSFPFPYFFLLARDRGFRKGWLEDRSMKEENVFSNFTLILTTFFLKWNIWLVMFHFLIYFCTLESYLCLFSQAFYGRMMDSVGATPSLLTSIRVASHRLSLSLSLSHSNYWLIEFFIYRIF